MLFGLAIANGVGKSLEDGKWNWKDIFNFMDAGVASFAAISGIEQVPLELEDLDEDERAYLVNLVKEKTEFKDEKAEAISDQAFRVGIELGALITLIGKK